MTSQRIKVFVVEDDFYTLDALRVFLSQDPRTIYVGGSQKPKDALEAIRASDLVEKPDLVLVDMRFRDAEGRERIEGLELIQTIDEMRGAGKLDAKILCLSMNLNPRIVISALNCGADGYLDKNQAAERIVDAVELVHQGSLVISPNVADIIMGLIKEASSEVVLLPSETPSSLSRRTEQVAYLYYRCGMTAREIAEELHIAESTVRTHIQKTKDVLKESSRSQIIQKLTRRRY